MVCAVNICLLVAVCILTLPIKILLGSVVQLDVYVRIFTLLHTLIVWLQQSVNWTLNSHISNTYTIIVGFSSTIGYICV